MEKRLDITKPWKRQFLEVEDKQHVPMTQAEKDLFKPSKNTTAEYIRKHIDTSR